MGAEESLEVRQAAARMEQGALLLDVREPEEWREGHAPDAVHIPLDELEGRRDELPADRPILTVCRSGARSAKAAAALRAAGHEVANVGGGMNAWHAAGLPLEPAGGGVLQ